MVLTLFTGIISGNNITKDLNTETEKVSTNVSDDNSSNQLEFKKYEEKELKTNNNEKKKSINKNKIYLKQGAIETNKSNLTTQSKPKQFYPDSKEKIYLIQFKDVIKDEWIQSLKSRDIELINYIPENGYLVKMEPGSKKDLQSIDYIQYTSIYKPNYKISPSINKTKNNLTLTIVTFENIDAQKTLDKINSTGTHIIKFGENCIRANVNLTGTNISDIAKINSVSWIEEYNRPRILNNDAISIMNVDDTNFIYSLDGSGQTIAIADTGIDTGVDDSSMHPDLQDSLTGIREYEDAEDYSGHGTHVAGSVVGDGKKSSGKYRGTAPNTDLYFQSLSPKDSKYLYPPNPLTELFKDAYNNGASIHSNSWGHSGNYGSQSSSVDEFMWNHKDMLILFAAGNSGANQETIISPGNAKNCLTVGASESSDPKDVASFSSRGPTEDGRVKPDVVAPGTYINSTRSSYDSDGSGYYTEKHGTSMATPLTAGAAASIRQYYVENSIQPTASLIKTTLINGAHDISSNDNRPNYAQGWGRVDLYNSIKTLANGDIHYSQKTNLSTDEIAETKFYVDDSTNPLRITISWTDYPGDPSASKMLINDLDLTVIDPSGDEYYSRSSVDNVEDVEIQNPEIGRYTVKVKGSNVPQGPQPFSMVTSGSIKTVDVSNIEINPENVTAYEDETLSFNADVYDQDGNEVELPVNWTITNTTVGVVNETGLFTAKNIGSTTIETECDGVKESTNVNVDKLITDATPDTDKKFGTPETLQEFSIDTYKNCNVTWKLNGSIIKSETLVTCSSYANNTADVGVYNITATAECSNGTEQVSWIWEIHEESYYTGYRVWDANKDLSLNYLWTSDSYSGLYRNLGSENSSESIKIHLDDKSDRNINEDDFEYSAKPVETAFKYEEFGTYKEIGFLAKPYFAGYSNSTNFTSNSSNMLAGDQLTKVVLNDNESRYVSVGSKISLKNGYTITPKQIDTDGNKVWFELSKDGNFVDDKIVDINDDSDYFVYSKDLGSVSNVSVIALDVGDIYKSNETVLVKGIFQISEDLIGLDIGNTYSKLQLESVSSNKLLMKNSDSISLDRGTTTDVADDIIIRAADNETLRFTLDTDKTSGYRYNLAGTVAEGENCGWFPINFDGLYYNLDNGLMSESFNVVYDNDRSIDEGNLEYNSCAIETDFEYPDWGKYESMGFMGEKYVSGYTSSTKFAENNTNLVSNNRLTKVLIDNNNVKTIKLDSALFLKNGYVLVPEQIDTDGNKVWFSLYKDGSFVDDKVVTVNDNFVYRIDMGTISHVPIIAVHISDIDKQSQEIEADGTFQVSENYESIHTGDMFGNMQLDTVSASQITMESNSSITLGKGETVYFMDDFKFKVADSNELRYYPQRDVTKKPELIKSYHPIENPMTKVDHTQEFSINIHNTGNITWNIDGNTQKTDTQTSSSTYKVSYDTNGMFNVTAIASYSNFTEQYEWSWNVSYNDTIAPNVSLTADTVELLSVNNPASISVSITDKYPNNTEFLIKDISDEIMLEKNITSHVNGENQYNFTWNATNSSNEPVANGKYYLVVNSTDDAGNTASKNISVTVDNEKPTIDIKDITGTHSAGDKVYTNSTLTINASASGTPGDGSPDNISDIKFVLDSKSTKFKKTLKPNYTNKYWSDTVNLSLLPDDGRYNVIVEAADSANNSNSSKSGIDLILDRKPPEFAPSIKRINDTHAWVNVTSSEELKNNPDVKINGNDVPVTPENDYWSGVFQLTGSSYDINTTGSDLSGNTGNDSSTANVETIETSNNTGKMSNEKTGTSITFNTSDNTKGTVTITETSMPQVELDKKFVGIHFLDVHVGDKLTANLTNATIKIKVDENELPKGLDDNNVSIRYYNKSNESWDKVNTNKKSLDGTKYWTSNVNHFSTYGAIADDDMKPNIDEVYPAEGSILDSSTSKVKVKFSYSDGQSGINTSKTTIKFESDDKTTSDNTTITSEYATYNSTELSVGKYNSTVTVYDNAGNSKTYTTSFEIAEQKTDENVTNTDTNINSGSSSSGGGGGGSSNTDEDLDNIIDDFVNQKYVGNDRHIWYNFDNKISKVKSVHFDAAEARGKTNTRLVILKSNSTMVDEKPPGKAYQNINIWVGKAGFDNIVENASIDFIVDKTWIRNNNIERSTIKMCRHHGSSWDELETEKLSENETIIKFRSDTPGFSPFAITGKMKQTQSITTDTQVENNRTNNNVSNESTPVDSDQEDDTIGVGAWDLKWIILAILSMIVSISIYIKKR
ncbi:S-layer-related duplication domain protein (plasmid) [Methanohalobium evestigatum Z-7303]|uniref:S-layer-related duplication domain protein n=1 Tax=Methanohalobium evestigatum (strain ATCC BAA-1072 / DSM 3721 / NBRC 107634 / OCM 161 / Z-7303) TaxID=644295 RepID=D7EBZ4_METEZ|nr:S-layer protein domain-containing protein [Methanohalobium evestigatum]ADI75116.1 S-layer-related duplication domain protein [Methanohalobium evestigatum Z-7303]